MAIQGNIQFEGGSIGPTAGRPGTIHSPKTDVLPDPKGMQLLYDSNLVCIHWKKIGRGKKKKKEKERKEPEPELHIVGRQRSNPSDHLALDSKSSSKRAYNCHGDQKNVIIGGFSVPL